MAKTKFTTKQSRASNGNSDGARLTIERLGHELETIALELGIARNVAHIATLAVERLSTDSCIEIASALSNHVDDALYLLIDRINQAVKDANLLGDAEVTHG